MNDTIQQELQSRIEAFAADITAILQRAVAQSIAAALPVAKRGPGRPAGVTARGKAAKQARAAGRPKGGPKRKAAPALFNEDALLREVKRAGGRRMEQIAKSLRTTTKAIGPSMKSLIKAKKVKSAGKARGTKYTAR